jgi:transcriptional regulator with XRE-family HTH domain
MRYHENMTAEIDVGSTFQLAAARRLKAEIIASGSTIPEAARRSGVSYDTIRRYFSGKRDFPLATFIQICASYDLDPGDLFHDAMKTKR